MRHIERPSARFLGLLYGQAALCGNRTAQVLIERNATARGILDAVARHSSGYVRRRLELDWMAGHETEAYGSVFADSMPVEHPLPESGARGSAKPLAADAQKFVPAGRA